MSSSPPPPPTPPPMGSPPPGSPPPPPPPPPNPSDTSNITSANYFFGFVITFVVLLLLFVGCGIGSWRRFRLIGTAWDERLQDMEGNPFSTRKRGRRRLVRPVFAETWIQPTTVTHLAPVTPSDRARWDGVQPISAALVWSRSKLAMCARKSSARTTGEAAAVETPRQDNDGSVRGMVTTLRSYVFPRRPRCDHPPRPPPVTRPPPEAIQVAVMIAMPSPPSPSSGVTSSRSQCVGHPEVGEYQIGVVRIPWPSGDGT